MANQDSKRDFAAMDDDRQRDIAAEGGRASHSGGNKGGNERGGSQQQERGGSGNFAQDRERASEAGRKGEQASQGGGYNR